ncbi:lymphocyte antigen 6G-like [Chelmon rostratus]|uniref:lymphocyte antigen 6G-like n=1 Tax=Chelmon rostratus TaxID=109905 RepID=UPI001BEAB359|nr:lymphocyte antigen 6G-like [Chelmon rostratus]
MHLCGVLVLLGTLSAAYGLKCYTCVTTNPSSCTDVATCPLGHDRCATAEKDGAVVKSCFGSDGCGGPIKCCEGDLCNGAIPTGSSVLLLLVSSAIITIFL